MLQTQSVFSSFSVNNMDSAKQFYTDVIGLRLDDETMGLQFSLPGGNSVFLYHKDDHQPASYTVLNFVVNNIDEAVTALLGQGVIFERYDTMRGTQDEKGVLRGIAAQQGPDIAWFKDPAGNILSVLQEK